VLLLSRLLRAMGWTEVDNDGGYEITEDDVREFEDLCRQMKLSKVENISMLCLGLHIISLVTCSML